jgi:hypothetical protein
MRARNIKPGFFSNEDLAEMPPEGRLLFIGLWCLADREGKLEDRPKRIKGELFRFDDLPVERLDSLLKQLCCLGLIIRYEKNGCNYIKIPKFLNHQRPHHNEKPSTIPEPLSTKGKSTCYQGKKQEQPKDKALRPDSLNPDPLNNESGILNPDSKDIAPLGPADAPGAAFFFSCPYFEVDLDYRLKLAKEYPALPDDLLRKELSKMEDWVSDNARKKKFKANGHLSNPKLFIKNWLEKVTIEAPFRRPLSKAEAVTAANLAAMKEALES